MSLATSVFDDEHLVSYAGLVPVMALAEQAGLSELVDKRDVAQLIQFWFSRTLNKRYIQAELISMRPGYGKSSSLRGAR